MQKKKESASEEEPSVERLDELVSALKEQRKKLHRAIIAKIDQSVKQKCDNFFMKLAELGQTGRSRSKVSKVAEILHSARVIAMREMRRKGEIQGKLVNYVRERQVEAADAEDKLREFIQALGRDSVGFTKFTKGIPEKVLFLCNRYSSSFSTVQVGLCEKLRSINALQTILSLICYSRLSKNAHNINLSDVSP